MLIRPSDEELAQVIEIALVTAKAYALREVFSATRALNRQVAVETLTAQIMAALRPYEISREARNSERCDSTLPLFPEVDGGKTLR